MKIIGIIPARYKSSRYPGKPLVSILGKPMVIRVCEIAAKALGVDNVYVATEDERIVDVVEKYGYNAIMTSDSHKTGTDRLAEVASKIEADIYINIQGDEPMLNPDDILKIAKVKEIHYNEVINGMAYISDEEDPNNINIPKVLVNKNNELIYMSRLPIPGIKGTEEKPAYLKQVCIYAFNKSELIIYKDNPVKAYYEKFEDIEILRFLDHNKRIRMVHVDNFSLAVDVPSDVKIVEAALLKENVK